MEERKAADVQKRGQSSTESEGSGSGGKNRDGRASDCNVFVEKCREVEYQQLGIQ